jgi:HPt (histidine-containing phosphotransfer) domain-containing protein
VRRAELFTAIERVLAGRPPAAATPDEADAPTVLLDPGRLLAACDGDAGLLAQMIAVFQSSVPGHLARIGDAVANRNTAALQEAVHKLRGLVAAFSTTAAEAARRLEQTAAGGQLDGADESYAELAALVHDLGPLLASLSIEDLQSRLPERR